jgi:hypothetical protein
MALPLLVPLFSCGQSTTAVDVVIMGGQSNMVGCSTYSTLADAVGSVKFQEYSVGYDGIKIAYDCWTKNSTDDYSRQNTSNGKFVKSLLGEGNSDLTFGMEVPIAEQLSSTAHKDKVFLIKYACGASALALDWTAPDSGSTKTMYTNFVNYVHQQLKVLKDSGYKPTIKAMLWMQGEGDAYPSICGEYYDQLHYLVTDLRKEFLSDSDSDGFAFIDGGISDSTSWPKYQVVNTAKQQFARENPERNIYIDTIGAGLDKTKLQADNAHYVATAMLSLGRLFCDALEPFLSAVASSSAK